jgi:hypothetical protein
MNIVNGSFHASLDASMRAVTDMRSPTWYNINNTSYGFIGNNVYADTINGRGSDSLELNYYDGGPVKIGSGTNGSKSLYAVGIYDNGSRVLSQQGSSYYQVNTWLQFNSGSIGLYYPGVIDAAPHFYPIGDTYGTFQTTGYKNSYQGLQFNSGGRHTYMVDTGGNGGAYNYSYWITYWNASAACLGIRGSTTSSSYSMYVTGGVYATGNVVAYSDARLKTNVTTVDSALDKVSKLRGVYYTRLPGKNPDVDTNRREIGVIAQEVNEVLPEVVTYAKDVDEYGVQYGNFAGLFIEAFKELQAEVRALRTEVETLRGRPGE